MADSVDVLFINPGDRKQIYQGLGDEFSAIEPPVFAGLFATYVRQKGHSVAIYDAPVMMASADEVARVATENFDAKLIVIVVYGFQPSASTQNMTAAGDIARKIKDAGTRARVMEWPCTATPADPWPSTITADAAEHSTSTAPSSRCSARISGPWLE